jgi:fatty-acyl-CoA synthase
MRLRDPVLDAGRAARAMAWRAATVARVGLRAGMAARLELPGALVLLRELPKGKPNPSLIYRYHARNTPHRAALVVPSLPGASGARGRDRVYSFHELDRAIDRAALALVRRGAGRGSAVLFALKNRAEAIVRPAAVSRVGGASVTTSWRSSAGELEYLANHSGAKVVFFDADIADTVRAAAPRISGVPADGFVCVGGQAPGFPTYDDFVATSGAAPGEAAIDADTGDAALVVYTSGTTGKPKGAVRKFPKEALATALAFIGETPMKVGETHLCVCPLYHSTAFGFVSFSYLLGDTIVLLPDFRPETFLWAVQQYRVQTTAVVPTMLHRLMDLGRDAVRSWDTSSLVSIYSGGAPLPGSLALEVMDTLGDKLWNFYGATETGLVTLASPKDLRASPGTIGRVVPGNEIRLVDERGQPCEVGQVGELYARSALMVEGYHADPDATKSSMLEGFFSVGDLARVDERGCYHLEGRKRDMIISGGVNVYPAEVEATLDAHPGVAEVAVVGVPDPEWGERVRAFVVAKNGARPTEAELKEHCKRSLAGYKVPREFVFLDALPKNPTGKVLKRELRELA